MEATPVKRELEHFKSVNQICRLCLSEECLDDIFKERDLHQWISDFLSIMVSIGDQMSQMICGICRIRLIEFHQFRVRCQEVQSVLESMLQKEKVQALKDLSACTRANQSEKHDLHDIKTEPNDYSVEIQRQKFETQPSNETECLLENSNNETETIPSHLESESEDFTYDYTEPTDMIEIGNVKFEIRAIDAVEQTDPSIRNETYRKQHLLECMAGEFGSESSVNYPIANDPKKSNPRIRARQVAESDEQLQCGVCLKLFPNRTSLGKHKRYHVTKKHECEICGKGFVDSYNLRRHIAAHERSFEREMAEKGIAKPFQCEVCQRLFKTKTKLKQHELMVHGPKDYICHVCEFSTAIKYALERHLLRRHKLNISIPTYQPRSN